MTKDSFVTGHFFLALASWCADLAIMRPSELVLVLVAPAVHERGATRRVRRYVARPPGRPMPAPLGATNSSPGACNAPTPASRCISRPACSQSITPPVAVARSSGYTLDASQGTQSTPQRTRGSSPTPRFLSEAGSLNPPLLSTTAPAVVSRTSGDDPWGRPPNSAIHNSVSEGATSIRSSL
jgi:hypothetical protein